MPSLISEAAREHDFGDVIAGPGRRLEHGYRLANATRHDVKILNVVNRKTCCGTIRVGKQILPPGDSTDIEVTLMVGGRFGRVAHETEVVTDSPADASIILGTSAQAVPPIRIEEGASSDRTLIMGGRPGRARFRVYSSGTPTEPAADLGRLELRSTIRVEWAGPKEPDSSDDGLRVESRPFAVVLDPGGPPGVRRAEVQVREGEAILGRQIVGWEVASPLAVSPKVIAMRSAQRAYRVVFQARDQAPFRITRVQSTVPGVQGRASASSAARTQTVEVEGSPGSENRRGILTMFTDHPLQQKVELPIVIVD